MSMNIRIDTHAARLLPSGERMIARESNDENGCLVDEVLVELAIAERGRRCVEG